MKVHLPDTAREAFQFTVLAAGIVLVVRLIVAAFGLWTDDASGDALAQACAPFRNGYPLIGAHVTVAGGMELVPRLAVAALFVLTAGLALALVMLPFGRLFKGGALRAAVLGGRIGLLLGAAWAVFSLLCLPPERTEISTEALVHRRSASFMQVVPIPFTMDEQHTSWAHVGAVALRTSTPQGDTTRTTVAVLANTLHGEAVIAQAMEGAGSGADARKQDALRLIQRLDELRGK